jgi:adenosylcobinamide-GDP ribazoletransferase
LLTGAFHEDGLADTADALGGAYDRDRLFAILKDSRIGSFGAAALVMSLVLRVCLLARLGPAAPLALVMVGAASRVPPVWLMAALPYVTTGDARSRPLTRGGAAQAVMATALAAGLLGAVHTALSPVAVLAMVAVSLAAVLLCGWRFHARAGGITGDFLGATQQVSEAGLLLALILTGPPT